MPRLFGGDSLVVFIELVVFMACATAPWNVCPSFVIAIALVWGSLWFDDQRFTTTTYYI